MTKDKRATMRNLCNPKRRSSLKKDFYADQVIVLLDALDDAIRDYGAAIEILAERTAGRDYWKAQAQFIKCRDCRRSQQDRNVGLYCNKYRQYRNPDDFCSRGIKREDAL